MRTYIKFDGNVNRSDIKKRWKNRCLMTCPDGAYSAELVRSVQTKKSKAPTALKEDGMVLKVIEGGKK